MVLRDGINHAAHRTGGSGISCTVVKPAGVITYSVVGRAVGGAAVQLSMRDIILGIIIDYTFASVITRVRRNRLDNILVIFIARVKNMR